MTFKYEIGQTVWFRGREYTVTNRRQDNGDLLYDLYLVIPQKKYPGTCYLVHPDQNTPKNAYEWAIHSKEIFAEFFHGRASLGSVETDDWNAVANFIKILTDPVTRMEVNHEEEALLRDGRAYSYSKVWLPHLLEATWRHPSPFHDCWMDVAGHWLPAYVPISGSHPVSEAWIDRLKWIAVGEGREVWEKCGAMLKEM